MSYARRTESSATLLRKLKIPTAPLYNQMHSTPKVYLQFFDYFFTIFQPYKRITCHVKMVSIYNLEIAVMSHLNILSRHVLKVGKNTQKNVQTAILFITITCKVQVRRATTTSSSQQIRHWKQWQQSVTGIYRSGYLPMQDAKYYS